VTDLIALAARFLAILAPVQRGKVTDFLPALLAMVKTIYLSKLHPLKYCARFVLFYRQYVTFSIFPQLDKGEATNTKRKIIDDNLANTK
jgi:hypothetical protein